MLLLPLAALAFAAAAISAFAAPHDTPLSGTAVITPQTRSIFANEGSTTIEFAVTPTGALPVTWFAFTPVPNTQLTLQPQNSTGPAGWSADPTATGRVVFKGGSALPAQTVSFQIKVATPIPAVDLPIEWTVEASYDNGAHKAIFIAPANDPAGQTSTVRVLKVLSGPQVALPLLAADNSVTAGQTVVVRTRVENRGSQPITARADYTASNAKMLGSAPVVQIPVGAQRDFDQNMQVETNQALKAVVSGTVRDVNAKAEANPKAAPWESTVEDPFDMQCVDVAPPTANAPSGGPATQAYSFLVSKKARPEIIFHQAWLTIASDAPFDTPRKENVTVPRPAPDAQDTTITANVQLDPGIVSGSDGMHDVFLKMIGTDGNGMPLPSQIKCVVQTRLDRKAPTRVIVNPILPELPVASGTVRRQSRIKSGDKLIAEVVITDERGCTSLNHARDIFIHQFDRNGNEITVDGVPNRIEILRPGTQTVHEVDEDECRIELELLTASDEKPPSYDGNAASMRIVLNAYDPNNSTTGMSPLVPVIPAAPRFTARTSGLDVVEVDFERCLSGTGLPTDWTIDGLPATSALPRACAGTPEGMQYSGVTLRLAKRLEHYNATPLVKFARTLPQELAQFLLAVGLDYTFVDSSGHQLAASEARAADRTPSPAPMISAISPGREFHTNGGSDRRPTFTISDATPGDIVCIHRDSVNNTPLGCVAYTNQSPLTIKSEVAFEDGAVVKDINLFIRSIDTNLNVSPPRTRVMHYDRIGPRITKATMYPSAAGSAGGLFPEAQIQVEFSDNIEAGDNYADDWELLDANGVRVPQVSVSSVEQCVAPSQRCRLLSINGSRTRLTSIKQLRYLAISPKPYTDKADNVAAQNQNAVNAGVGPQPINQPQPPTIPPSAPGAPAAPSLPPLPPPPASRLD